MIADEPRILGLGFAVPSNMRTNDDPIFDPLKERLRRTNQSNPFQGYNRRGVLGPGEDLMTIMLPAALDALAAADVSPAEIDMLLGYASVSPYTTPNELARLHQLLNLSSSCYVVPLNNEFSNFNAGLLFADALIRTGRARHILIVAGCNWTRHVDYLTVQSVSAGDGAGAAVLGRSDNSTQWRVVDQQTLTVSSYFGSMYMQGEPYRQQPPRDDQKQLWTDPFFHITEQGMHGFAAFGGEQAPRTVTTLLSRNALAPSDIALIAHQASTVLFDMWREVLQPNQLISTIDLFGNLTLAGIPVNLAWSALHRPIDEDHLVLFALSPDMHANALLLARNG